MKKGAKVLILAGIFIALSALIGNVHAMSIEPASIYQERLVQYALGDQYPISKAAVVKSQRHKNAYYIGAIFYAEGCGNLIGIWLTNGSKYHPTVLYSVDGFAHQFSGMRKASETKAAAYSWDPESKLLRKYLGGK